VSSEEGNRLIGSDPEEWLSGSAVAGFLRGEAERSGGNVSSVSSETEVYEEGTVGWATARLTLSVPNGAYVTPRWSAVLRKEGDVWRFLQAHASIAVSDDEVGWECAGLDVRVSVLAHTPGLVVFSRSHSQRVFPPRASCGRSKLQKCSNS
jgi:hypothetical protein